MTTSEQRAVPVAVGPSYPVRPGRPHPLGATVTREGTNFALFAQDATSVQLLLFERHDSPRPFQVVDLDPDRNRTANVWHCEVEGVGEDTAYGYRVDGPHDLSGRGHRFDPGKVLLDPYGRGASSRRWDRVAACRPGDNVESSMRSVVVDVAGLRLGGRPTAQPAPRRHGHLRDARQGAHGVAVVRGRAPGDLRGRDREDPVPAVARDHRRRAAAGVRVRPVGVLGDQPADRRPDRQLLGLQPALVLRPARPVRGDPGRGRDDPRVPGHGQGAPPRRHRGHPRRRLQPHGRGQPRGPDDQLPGPRQPGLLPARARPGPGTRTSRAAATR